MPLITKDKTFTYEVAFSFLQQDESLAYQIKDLIQDRLSTFIYSEHQKDIVGQDGINVFTSVFAEEARIVVVLYREGWGLTAWTRVEETAIKGRTLEESADFTIFASLDKNKPKWLSKSQMWYDIEQYGSSPFAAIIEKKVAEYGGQIREETLEDRSARYKRELDRKTELMNYFNSQNGYIDALTEAVRLLELTDKEAQNIQTATRLNFGISKNFRSQNKYLYVTAESFGLTFHWIQGSNLRDTYLLVFFANADFYDSNPKRSVNAQYIGDKINYRFHLNESNQKGWNQSNTNNFLTTEILVTKWLKEFIEKVRQERNKQKNLSDEED